METYKEDFIDFLWDNGALKFGDFKLKSGRHSPYFVNLGNLIGNGQNLRKLGDFYSQALENEIGLENFDVVFGPADKGAPLSVSVAIALASLNEINRDVVYNRKLPKDHGEGTEKNVQKNWLFGKKLEGTEKIVIVDDVFTTGKTKYDAIDLFDKVSEDLDYVGVLIGVDRQEIGTSGKSAIGEFMETKNVPVYSIVNIGEVFNYLESEGKISPVMVIKMKNYVGKFGTNEVKKTIKLKGLYSP